MLVLYVIVVSVAVLSALVGGLTGYFYFKARQKERLEMLENLARDIAEREQSMGCEEDARETSPNQSDAKQIRTLRIELEQKKQEMQILREDFDVEVHVLSDEIAELKRKLAGTSEDRRRLQRWEEDLATQREAAQRERDAAQAERVKLAESRADLEREREDLAQMRRHLRQREDQLDDRLLAIPLEAFSSRQEGMLIRRLRQEIKRQRDELEALYTARRRAS